MFLLLGKLGITATLRCQKKKKKKKNHLFQTESDKPRINCLNMDFPREVFHAGFSTNLCSTSEASSVLTSNCPSVCYSDGQAGLKFGSHRMKPPSHVSTSVTKVKESYCWTVKEQEEKLLGFRMLLMGTPINGFTPHAMS